MPKSCASTRCCDLGSPTPRRESRVTPEEPAAGNPHGGVREGGEQNGHGGPKRARSWKRRIEPRKAYRSWRSPLLGDLRAKNGRLSSCRLCRGRHVPIGIAQLECV